jgi:hypothetical protein
MLLVACTAAALLFVSQQIESTKIGYQINQQQLALNEVLDQRQMLLYNVCYQKSPENLQQSFNKSSKKPGDFQILANRQIIILTSNTKQTNNQIRTAKKSASSLTNFFGLTSLAEAKTQDER